MKRHGVCAIVLCLALLCCGAGCATELLGSPIPEIRKNFNRLLVTNACPRCDLRGVVLNRIDLFGADLSGANLAGAQLVQASLAGANLRHANLRGAWLGGADMSGTDLTGADLEGANFTLNKSGSSAVAQNEDENNGWQATAAAANTVSSALNEIFALQPAAPIQEVAPVVPTGSPFNNEISSFAKSAMEQSRHSVDEIPVIEPVFSYPTKRPPKLRFWERIWLDAREKKQDNKIVPLDDGSLEAAAQPPQGAVP
ncbi:pentapeptide repeat-containing protein [Candidatus Electronema sp. TJ]|uniref:pentapeptide repeat-containing protein n=1 Tax=Candidatus Electronema sp. TJ TaxID=3401573 RepID=UPI003AA915BE